jgi:uncharacterized protein YeaO (DUF488 family)
MAIYTGCILIPPKPGCLRISIMSRHTLNDGQTPDPRIDIFSSFHLHLPLLGPPPKLIGGYYKRGISWEVFAQEYLEYISNNDLCLQLLKALADKAETQDFELVCIEELPDHCHRKLLADWLKKSFPKLKIIIK